MTLWHWMILVVAAKDLAVIGAIVALWVYIPDHYTAVRSHS